MASRWFESWRSQLQERRNSRYVRSRQNLGHPMTEDQGRPLTVDQIYIERSTSTGYDSRPHQLGRVHPRQQWHVEGTRHVSSLLMTLASIRHVESFHLKSFFIIRKYSKIIKSRTLKLRKGHASGVLRFRQFWRLGGYEDSKESTPKSRQSSISSGDWIMIVDLVKCSSTHSSLAFGPRCWSYGIRISKENYNMSL
jgi:hypothetical protein